MCRSDRIGYHAVRIIVKPVIYPLSDISAHIKNTVPVRQFLPCFMHLTSRIDIIPCVITRIIYAVPEIFSLTSCPAGILPFCFSRQSVTKPVEMCLKIFKNKRAGLGAADRSICVNRIIPLLFAQFIAIQNRIIPGYTVNRKTVADILSCT